MMDTLTTILDILLGLMGLWGPVWLVVLSALFSSVLLLFIFRLVSNREGIRRARGRVTGALLAIRLFRDEPASTIRCFGAMLAAFPRYLGLTLVPLVVTIVPMLLILVHLGSRLEHLPVLPDTGCVVAVEVAPGVDPGRVALVEAQGVEVTAPPLRIPALREINWRVKDVPDGGSKLVDGGTLVFTLDGKRFKKRLDAGLILHPVSTTRTADFWSHLLHPREPRLPADLGVTRVTVHHPPRDFEILGLAMHWLVAWFLLVLVFAFLLKGLFGVEV